MTPPMVPVTETGPAVVITTSSRITVRNRSAAMPISSGVQFCRMIPNLLPEKRPMTSSAAHAAAQALGDDADHLVGDVVSVGLVDAPEIVDRDKQEPAGGLCQCRVAQKLGSSCSVRCQRLISPDSTSKRDR